jgi:hypothetical protein
MKKMIFAGMAGTVLLGLSGAVFLGCSPKKIAAGDVPLPPTMNDTIVPTDYADEHNWLYITEQPEKQADVFYVYPTAWMRNEGDPYVCAIDNESMLKGAAENLLTQASAYEDAGNIYAPFYRQLDVMHFLPRPVEEANLYAFGIPYHDVVAAFEYFLNHYNNGRPFILAGHSQGSIMIRQLLKVYMKEHPEVYSRMIAAYVIGYSITEQDLDENPHLQFAKDADGTGVIISYNTEAPNRNTKNPTTLPGSVAINPVSWTLGTEYASVNKNAGSRFYDANGAWKDVPALADAAVNLERGTVICSSVDINEYSFQGVLSEVFPKGVFHNYDYPFYYHNIRENALRRTMNYLKANQ